MPENIMQLIVECKQKQSCMFNFCDIFYLLPLELRKQHDETPVLCVHVCARARVCVCVRA